MVFPRNFSPTEGAARRSRVGLMVGAGALLALLLLINQATPDLPRDGEVGEVRNPDPPPRLVAEWRSWEPVAFLTGGSSPTVAMIVGASFEPQQVRICDALSGKTLATLHPKDHTNLSPPAVSPDGKYIAAPGNRVDEMDSCVVHVWEVATAKEVCTLPFQSTWGSNPAFSPDSRCLAFGEGDNFIKLWNIPSGKLFRSINTPPDGGRDVTFTPDGCRIVSTGRKNPGSAIRIWDVATGKLERTLSDNRYSYGDIHLRPPDGKLAAVGCAKIGLAKMGLRAICLWDLESGQLLATLRDVDVVGDFNKNGRWLALRHTDLLGNSNVSIWDVSRRKVLHKLPFKGRLRSANFSPDGRWLAAIWSNQDGKNFLTLWDMYPE